MAQNNLDLLAGTGLGISDVGKSKGGLGISTGASELAIADRLDSSNPIQALLKGEQIFKARERTDKMAQLNEILQNAETELQKQKTTAQEVQNRMKEFELSQQKNLATTQTVFQQLNTQLGLGDAQGAVQSANALLQLGNMKNVIVDGYQGNGIFTTRTVGSDGNVITDTATVDELAAGIPTDKRADFMSQSLAAGIAGRAEAEKLRSRQEEAQAGLSQTGEGIRAQAGFGVTQRTQDVTDRFQQAAIDADIKMSEALAERAATARQNFGARQVLASNVDSANTGLVGDLILDVDRLGKQFGFNLGLDDDSSLSQIKLATQQFIQPLIEAQGRSFSDADRKAAEGAIAGIGNSPLDNKLYLGARSLLDKWDVERDNLATSLLREGRGQDIRSAVDEYNAKQQGKMTFVLDTMRKAHESGLSTEEVIEKLTNAGIL